MAFCSDDTFPPPCGNVVWAEGVVTVVRVVRIFIAASSADCTLMCTNRRTIHNRTGNFGGIGGLLMQSPGGGAKQSGTHQLGKARGNREFRCCCTHPSSTKKYQKISRLTQVLSAVLNHGLSGARLSRPGPDARRGNCRSEPVRPRHGFPDTSGP